MWFLPLILSFNNYLSVFLMICLLLVGLIVFELTANWVNCCFYSPKHEPPMITKTAIFLTFHHQSAMGHPSFNGTHLGHTYILHIDEYDPSSPQGAKFPSFGTSVCQTHTGTIGGKYALVSITFSNRPYKAM